MCVDCRQPLDERPPEKEETDGVWDICVLTVADLAVGILPPTLHRAVVQHNTGVTFTEIYRDGGFPRTK